MNTTQAAGRINRTSVPMMSSRWVRLAFNFPGDCLCRGFLILAPLVALTVRRVFKTALEPIFHALAQAETLFSLWPHF